MADVIGKGTVEILNGNSISLAGNASGVVTAVLKCLEAALNLTATILANEEAKKNRRFQDTTLSLEVIVTNYWFWHTN